MKTINVTDETYTAPMFGRIFMGGRIADKVLQIGNRFNVANVLLALVALRWI